MVRLLFLMVVRCAPKCLYGTTILFPDGDPDLVV
jgi:hypothetical protein